MLQHLKVENYALIRALEIDFCDGFTAITGETGAGKSILIGALSLILGQRADSQALFDTAHKCIIEGTFSISNYQLESFFDTNDLDFDTLVILRREITPYGKSRAFINDTPVSLQLLKELGSKLVDIHSQNAVLTLNNPAIYRSLIDDFAENQQLLAKYKKAFRELEEMKIEAEQLKEKERNANRDKDYLKFLQDELFKAALINGEQQELEDELKIQSHAEEIKSALHQAQYTLSGSDDGIDNTISGLCSSLNRISSWHPLLAEICSRINSLYIELNDISSEINHIDESISFDPERINQINQRLGLLYHLQQKHRVSSVGDLLRLQEDINTSLIGIESLQVKILETEERLRQQKALVLNLAKELSASRNNSYKPFEDSLLILLKQLGMPEAAFQVQSRFLDEPGKDGMDEIVFLFNANRGGVLKTLSHIASGGELSRFMLSLKYTLSDRKRLPTLILDEIDSGISGEIAGKMGKMMLQMAQTMQVITITHLPQIAAKAQAHFWVYKESDSTSSHSNVRMLQPEERIHEIAKMLSDQHVTDSAITAARELIGV